MFIPTNTASAHPQPAATNTRHAAEVRFEICCSARTLEVHLDGAAPEYLATPAEKALIRAAIEKMKADDDRISKCNRPARMEKIRLNRASILAGENVDAIVEPAFHAAGDAQENLLYERRTATGNSVRELGNILVERVIPHLEQKLAELKARDESEAEFYGVTVSLSSAYHGLAKAIRLLKGRIVGHGANYDPRQCLFGLVKFD